MQQISDAISFLEHSRTHTHTHTLQTYMHVHTHTTCSRHFLANMHTNKKKSSMHSNKICIYKMVVWKHYLHQPLPDQTMLTSAPKHKITGVTAADIDKTSMYKLYRWPSIRCQRYALDTVACLGYVLHIVGTHALLCTLYSWYVMH